MIHLEFPWWAIPLAGLAIVVVVSGFYLWWCARGGNLPPW